MMTGYENTAGEISYDCMDGPHKDMIQGLISICSHHNTLIECMVKTENFLPNIIVLNPNWPSNGITLGDKNFYGQCLLKLLAEIEYRKMVNAIEEL